MGRWRTIEVGRRPPLALPRANQPTPHITNTFIRKKRRIILRGMDSPICWQDSSQREGSCLSGAKVRDIKRKLPGLVEPSDHYPLLVIQVGSDGVEGRTPETIKQDFRVLGHLAKGESAQIVLSFLSAWGMNTVKNRKTSLMAKRLVP